ncbi:hypothetical protein FH972_010121 [Carpinus fangiana]|uniref:Neprosin PEP catalytic domain-containing protein n=1 Tax=Carpinus fangiana TaxID=176857 RepID=A0A660KTG2_9ROSI|nr:hypothetical protein FH972_010121 [Carpinus fangiana]
MKPSSNIPNETKGDSYDAEMLQGLLDIEECPEGTIPVRHEREDEYYEHRALPSRRKNLNLQADDYNHEGTRYARVNLKDNQYYQGARAFINLWHPVTNPGEVSIAQIWLRGGPSGREDTIEAGWIVSLTKYCPSLEDKRQL